MIEGVKTKQLKPHCDERGRVMEMLRSDDDCYQKFGQCYMTTAGPGVVKAWHYHKKQTDYFTCVAGMMKLVLFDSRDGSPTKGQVNEFFLGIHNPIMVVIPPGGTSKLTCSLALCECHMKNSPPFRFRPPSPGGRSPDTPRKGLPL